MVIKQGVAYGIVQGLSDFWKCEELQDFTVTLGTTKFGCHRFLLAACSWFFKGLFRSGMIETKLKCVTIDISYETFELILETLYTGHDVLTNDNVIDIWRAAHQLQIPFLIKECEEFAVSTLSLDNYIEYYKIAKLFESKEVLDIVWPFMLKNANSFFQTNLFYELQVPDVLRLIQSQDLETTSEDDVVHALLGWVEFRPRQQDDSIKVHSDENSGQKRIKTDFTS
uniref:Kelch-like protein 40b isoform X3 n=1 Tax=Biomphalaria glabrata TaxID=6526 RepID=A0A9W2Z0P7_BIOGL|nr:kelch-like protein 40b isoform X3 [Biomphalaria glabrata]